MPFISVQSCTKISARYAISVARKIGCLVFLLWEDIVEVCEPLLWHQTCIPILVTVSRFLYLVSLFLLQVKPKMITTFLASLMGRMILCGAIDARKAVEPPTGAVAAMKVSASPAPAPKPAAAGGGPSPAPVLLPGQPSPAAVAKANQTSKPYGR